MCEIGQPEEQKKAGISPASSFAFRARFYVVERGLATITVAGTELVVGAASVHPMSTPGVQAGRLGLICCVSVGGVDGLTDVGMLM